MAIILEEQLVAILNADTIADGKAWVTVNTCSLTVIHNEVSGDFSPFTSAKHSPNR